MQNNINSSYSLSKNQQFQRNKLKKNKNTPVISTIDPITTEQNKKMPNNLKSQLVQNKENSNSQQSLHFSAQNSSTQSSDVKYQNHNTIQNQLKEWSAVIIVAFILHLIIRTLIIEIFEIPTGSMIETLMIGDNVAVTKYSYGYGPYSSLVDLPISKRILAQKPERGDIIVFQSTNNNGKKYIKRLIGLPGDMIRVQEGIIEINGEAIQRTKHKEQYESIDDHGNHRLYDKYTETLPNGVSYRVLGDTRADVDAFPDSTFFYHVPENHYFFMGDNRNNSIDSRFLSEMGYVPDLNLVGKARSVLWNKKVILNSIMKNWYLLIIAGFLVASMAIAWHQLKKQK